MKVWVQRGHCFRTSGSTGTSGEQDYVNRVARDAMNAIDGNGHIVHLALADERITGQWDLFVALHCDGSTSSTASGASVGYRDAAGRTAAHVWKGRFAQRGWPYGFRDDNYTDALRFYYGTGWAASAGIPRAFILEHGFLTNPTKDRAWLTSADGRRGAALALADTINLLAGDGPADDVDGGDSMYAVTKDSPTWLIKEWQRVLNHWHKEKGLTRAPLEVDGAWGKATDAMWKAVAGKTSVTVFEEGRVLTASYVKLSHAKEHAGGQS